MDKDCRAKTLEEAQVSSNSESEEQEVEVGFDDILNNSDSDGY